MKSKKIVYLILTLAIAVIVAMWFVNGAEIEDAWLYIASIAIVIAGIPATRLKKDKDPQ